MKQSSWAALVVMCIATAIIVYIGVFSIVANSESYYESKFKEFDVYSKFNISVEELHSENSKLLFYLENGKEEIEGTWFNAREKIHLLEVRQLYQKIYMLQTVCALIVIMSLLAVVFLNGKTDEGFVKRVLIRYLIGTGIAVFGLCVFFLVMMLTFSSSFITFHEVLFETDTWMLDPATDNLINMFPQQFFFDIFVSIVVGSLIVGCLFMVVGFVVRGKKEKKIEKHKNVKYGKRKK